MMLLEGKMMRTNETAVDLSTSETELFPIGQVPIGHSSTSTGIAAIGADGTETWLCSPLRVASRFRDALGTGWGRVVEMTDSDGTVHCEAILDADIVSGWSCVLRRLVGVGLRVDTPPSRRRTASATSSSTAHRRRPRSRQKGLVGGMRRKRRSSLGAGGAL